MEEVPKLVCWLTYWDRLASRIDPDQTALKEQPDLDLYCLLSPVLIKKFKYHVIPKEAIISNWYFTPPVLALSLL